MSQAHHNIYQYPIETYLQALRDCYKKSLFWTAQRFLGYKDITLNTHGPIVSSLESASKRKLICVPRGTFKSSIASVSYPIWLLMNNPNLRILIDSELYTNSKNFLREIKGHLESPRFIELFGNWKSRTWNDSEIILAHRTKKYKEPSITVGGIGTTKVGQHYDYIIGDDYNSPANSGTPEARKKVIDHYKYNTSIFDVSGTYAVIGTRYAEDDIIGWVLQNELGLANEAKLGSMQRHGGVIYV